MLGFRVLYDSGSMGRHGNQRTRPELRGRVSFGPTSVSSGKEADNVSAKFTDASSSAYTEFISRGSRACSAVLLQRLEGLTPQEFARRAMLTGAAD
jgi:hypothetical protein